jgi:ATP-dependent protease HslVU (ClpYQ) peptidase subunit
VQLGILAVLRGSLDEARGLLERFDHAFSAGTQLTQRQAVGIARDQPRRAQ